MAQLQRKLALRGCSANTASAVLHDLQEAGWQSDLRFAEVLARSRVDQGYGPLRILADLWQARINDDDIRHTLENLDCDFFERAVEIQTRRFGAGLPSCAAERQKQYRYLAARGFEADHIRAALKGEPDG